MTTEIQNGNTFLFLLYREKFFVSGQNGFLCLINWRADMSVCGGYAFFYRKIVIPFSSSVLANIFMTLSPTVKQVFVVFDWICQSNIT